MYETATGINFCLILDDTTVITEENMDELFTNTTRFGQDQKMKTTKIVRMKMTIGTRIHISVIVVLLITNGCDPATRVEEAERPVIKRTFYSDGLLSTEYFVVLDSVRDGRFRKFYPNGKIEFEVDYSNDRKDGNEKGYYESGNVQYVIPYKKGAKSGVSNWFSENGELKATIPYYKGKPVGELLYFYSNGKIQNYVVNDFDGNPKFDMTLDSVGNILNVSGTAIVDVSYNGENLKVGDTLKVLFLVATPPKCEFEFYIFKDIHEENRRLELPIDTLRSVVTWREAVTEVGQFDWGGYLKVRFQNGSEKNYSFVGKLNATE